MSDRTELLESAFDALPEGLARLHEYARKGIVSSMCASGNRVASEEREQGCLSS